MNIFLAAFISYFPFFIWVLQEAMKDLYNENGQVRRSF